MTGSDKARTLRNMTQTATAQRSTAKRRLPGILLALGGAVLAWIGYDQYSTAAGRMAFANGVNDYGRAFGDPIPLENTAQFVTAQHWGIGILIFGALVLLTGVVLAVARR